jgi:outer membrane protein TolC
LGEWRDSWDLSVNVSWSLWDGGRRRAEEAEAAAATRALVARAADFDRQLAFEVEQRQLEIDSSHAAIAAANDGVGAAVEARRVIGERFGAGVATSTDVLDADTAVLQAQLDRTRAIANAHLAVARLDRAVGR